MGNRNHLDQGWSLEKFWGNGRQGETLAGEKGEAAAAEIGWEDVTGTLGEEYGILIRIWVFVLLSFYPSFKRIFDLLEVNVMDVGQVVSVSGIESEIASLLEGVWKWPHWVRMTWWYAWKLSVSIWATRLVAGRSPWELASQPIIWFSRCIGLMAGTNLDKSLLIQVCTSVKSAWTFSLKYSEDRLGKSWKKGELFRQVV